MTLKNHQRRPAAGSPHEHPTPDRPPRQCPRRLQRPTWRRLPPGPATRLLPAGPLPTGPRRRPGARPPGVATTPGPPRPPRPTRPTRPPTPPTLAPTPPPTTGRRLHPRPPGPVRLYRAGRRRQPASGPSLAGRLPQRTRPGRRPPEPAHTSGRRAGWPTPGGAGRTHPAVASASGDRRDLRGPQAGVDGGGTGEPVLASWPTVGATGWSRLGGRVGALAGPGAGHARCRDGPGQGRRTGKRGAAAERAVAGRGPGRPLSLAAGRDAGVAAAARAGVAGAGGGRAGGQGTGPRQPSGPEANRSGGDGRPALASGGSGLRPLVGGGGGVAACAGRGVAPVHPHGRVEYTTTGSGGGGRGVAGVERPGMGQGAATIGPPRSVHVPGPDAGETGVHDRRARE